MVGVAVGVVVVVVVVVAVGVVVGVAVVVGVVVAVGVAVVVAVGVGVVVVVAVGVGVAVVVESDCPGDLTENIGDHRDTTYSAGLPVTRAVTLWICRGCGHHLSVSEGVLLNDFTPPGRFAAAVLDPRD